MKLQEIVRDINIEDSTADEAQSDVTIDECLSQRSSLSHIEDMAIDITIVENRPTSSSANSEATMHESDQDESDHDDTDDGDYQEQDAVRGVVVSITDDVVYEEPEVLDAVFEVDVDAGSDVDVEVEVEVMEEDLGVLSEEGETYVRPTKEESSTPDESGSSENEGKTLLAVGSINLRKTRLSVF